MPRKQLTQKTLSLLGRNKVGGNSLVGGYARKVHRLAVQAQRLAASMERRLPKLKDPKLEENAERASGMLKHLAVGVEEMARNLETLGAEYVPPRRAKATGKQAPAKGGERRDGDRGPLFRGIARRRAAREPEDEGVRGPELTHESPGGDSDPVGADDRARTTDAPPGPATNEEDDNHG